MSLGLNNLLRNIIINVSSNKIGRKQHIIQQKLDLNFYNNQVIDYRLYLAKDQTGKWLCTGWVAKNGVPGSIVSNHSNGGTVQPAFYTLQESLGLTSETTEDLKQQFFTVACRAAECLEKQSGKLFGDLGVDMAVDKNKHIWIIELSHRFVDDTLPPWYK
ncbi:YheC/YheD family protein [Neobacillus sp. 114]|uniref:YheC/YheD family protein n=1 Tax=Neobacillus sp. 114 TaxID=3048535 RepID=UPI001C22E637|nr:YheC/YheD family protein [Neobacillus sp. 114]MBU8918020.1 YheC/YheD family protein [Bacillus sp. FJAT-29953]